MRRQLKAPLTWTLIVLIAASGCHPTQPFYFHNDGDLSHYLSVATQTEHPDVDHPHLAEVENAIAPLTISNPEFSEIWDLTVEECVHIALQNSKVVRNAGAIQANFGFSDALIERVTGFITAYDPSITETNIISTPGSSITVANPSTTNGATSNGFGQIQNGSSARAATAANIGGLADALSDFDAQFSAGGNYTVTDRPNNRNGITSEFTPAIQHEDTGEMGIALSKKTQSGAVFTFRNMTQSDWQNTPISNRPIPGDWIATIETIADIPLMRGRGVQINRLPITLARINVDVNIADFEAAVRNMMMDLEVAYWDLHFSYRNLEATKIGRDSSLVTWKIVYEKWSKGVSPVQEEAQARGQYFQFRAGVEAALRDVYGNETRLRWLMGLAATDGRLIRPKDEPSMARVEFDWQKIHTEAMFRSTELRQQKWRLKQRELELIGAKNQLLPQLNAAVLFRLLGRGDQYASAQANQPSFVQQAAAGGSGSVPSTAIDSLMSGQYSEAGTYLTYIPARIGMRRELAGIRNAQMQIARAKAQLEEMELNLSHLLTAAIRDMDANFLISQTHFNRWVAAEKEVESVQALYEGGKQTLDLVLDAQRRRATAQSDYYRSITDYNKSLAMVHYRKGSLLEHNGVGMKEGPWPQKAYYDALGRARERDSSYYLNYGWTRPKVVSRGPVDQVTGQAEPRGKESNQPELVPTPEGTTPDGTMPATPMPMPSNGTPPAPQGPTTSVPNLLSPTMGMGWPNGPSNVRKASANMPVDSAFDWGNIATPSSEDAGIQVPARTGGGVRYNADASQAKAPTRTIFNMGNPPANADAE